MKHVNERSFASGGHLLYVKQRRELLVCVTERLTESETDIIEKRFARSWRVPDDSIFHMLQATPINPRKLLLLYQVTRDSYIRNVDVSASVGNEMYNPRGAGGFRRR
jgi:hypothetical protein